MNWERIEWRVVSPRSILPVSFASGSLGPRQEQPGNESEVSFKVSELH